MGRKKNIRPTQYSQDKRSQTYNKYQKTEKVPINITKVNCYHSQYKSSIRPESPDRKEESMIG